MTEPRTEAGRTLLSELVSDDWDETLTAPMILAIEEEAAALAATGDSASPDRAGLLGTDVYCPVVGVHEHAFRGPHHFREWDPDAATGDSEGRQAPCDDEQLRSAFMKGVESAEEARAIKEAGDSEGLLDVERLASAIDAVIGPGEDEEGYLVTSAEVASIAAEYARLSSKEADHD